MHLLIFVETLLIMHKYFLNKRDLNYFNLESCVCTKIQWSMLSFTAEKWSFWSGSVLKALGGYNFKNVSVCLHKHVEQESY